MKKLIPMAIFLCAALADKGGKGKGHKHEGRHAAESVESDSGKSGRGKKDDSLFGFNDREVSAITGVLRHLYGVDGKEVEIVRPSAKFCPPGLAKKNNGCLPPGLAKKYEIGQPLGRDVTVKSLPDILREQLGLPPKGRKYVQVDDDVLLIEEGTKLVLDAIGIGRK